MLRKSFNATFVRINAKRKYAIDLAFLFRLIGLLKLKYNARILEKFQRVLSMYYQILQYQLLTSELFRTPATPIGTQNQKRSSKRSREGSPLHHQQQHQQAAASNEDRTYSLRNGLYDKLASHFPERMTHPRGHLIDLIPYTSSLSNDNMLS